MKFNWGTGIAIAIVGFISFIMYFVITMSTDNTYSHDLVTDKYYQQELEYQKQIDAEKNASNLENNIKIIPTKEGLQIQFPEEIKLNSKLTTFSNFISHQCQKQTRNSLHKDWRLFFSCSK